MIYFEQKIFSLDSLTRALAIRFLLSEMPSYKYALNFLYSNLVCPLIAQISAHSAKICNSTLVRNRFF